MINAYVYDNKVPPFNKRGEVDILARFMAHKIGDLHNSSMGLAGINPRRNSEGPILLTIGIN